MEQRIVPHSHAIVYFRHAHISCDRMIFGTVVKIPKSRDASEVITIAKNVLKSRLKDGIESFKPYLADHVIKNVHESNILDMKNWLPEVNMEGGFSLQHARAIMAEQFIYKEREGKLVINRRYYKTYKQF